MKRQPQFPASEQAWGCPEAEGCSYLGPVLSSEGTFPRSNPTPKATLLISLARTGHMLAETIQSLVRGQRGQTGWINQGPPGRDGITGGRATWTRRDARVGDVADRVCLLA